MNSDSSVKLHSSKTNPLPIISSLWLTLCLGQREMEYLLDPPETLPQEAWFATSWESLKSILFPLDYSLRGSSTIPVTIYQTLTLTSKIDTVMTSLITSRANTKMLEFCLPGQNGRRNLASLTWREFSASHAMKLPPSLHSSFSVPVEIHVLVSHSLIPSKNLNKLANYSGGTLSFNTLPHWRHKFDKKRAMQLELSLAQNQLMKLPRHTETIVFPLTVKTLKTLE